MVQLFESQPDCYKQFIVISVCDIMSWINRRQYKDNPAMYMYVEHSPWSSNYSETPGFH